MSFASRIVIFLVLCYFTIPLQAQTDDYFTQNTLRYNTRTYDVSVRSLQVHPVSYPLDDAIIQLNSDEKLSVSFDDLAGGIQVYMYTIIHCDAFWNPSPLQASEYIDGFYDDEIRTYIQSFNTTTHYTHYFFEFPNQYLKPRYSGNYLIVIYVDDPSTPVATARIMVAENSLKIDQLKIKRSSTASLMRTHQEADFKIIYNNSIISNPSRDLKVMILQNNRWDNAIKNIPPRNIRSDELDYDYDDLNNFEAGNEFRNFDIKSLRYNSEYVGAIRYNKQYDVYLKPGFSKESSPYYSETDINGRFLIKTEDMEDSSIEADYAMVHFVYPSEYPLSNGSLYVFGALSYWDFIPEAKMNYNFDKKQYECSLLLKQGYYNYCFAYLEQKKSSASLQKTEGNHYEAENNYTVLVYYRKPGQVFDRLVAVSHASSRISY